MKNQKVLKSEIVRDSQTMKKLRKDIININNIEMIPVRSSKIESIGLSNNKNLIVKYKDGSLYIYLHAEVTFKQIINSPSPTRFYNTLIKNKFRCYKLR